MNKDEILEEAVALLHDFANRYDDLYYFPENKKYPNDLAERLCELNKKVEVKNETIRD